MTIMIASDASDCDAWLLFMLFRNSYAVYAISSLDTDDLSGSLYWSGGEASGWRQHGAPPSQFVQQEAPQYVHMSSCIDDGALALQGSPENCPSMAAVPQLCDSALVAQACAQRGWKSPLWPLAHHQAPPPLHAPSPCA